MDVRADCGLTHAKQDDVHKAWKAKHPQLAHEIDQIELLTYDGSSIEK
jgi:hypothetical protein